MFINKLGRKLVKLLRHTACQERLNINNQGYVIIDDILQLEQFSEYTLYAVLCAVALDDKQRLKLNYKARPLEITAQNGHTIKLVKIAYERILSHQYPILVHSTTRKAWESIRNDAIKLMKRNEVHMYSLAACRKHLTTWRERGKEVIIFIDARRCEQKKIELLMTGNEVVVSREEIPASCIRRVQLFNGSTIYDDRCITSAASKEKMKRTNPRKKIAVRGNM